MRACFATIVSANYLAYAAVLRDSLARHSPESDFRVLLVDRPLAATQAAARDSGLQITWAHELGLTDFEQLAYRYDLVEFNTALKPSFLRSLLAQGFDKVVYADPDTCFFSAPQAILDALDSAQIVLTPHALAPVMDGLRPSDIDFMRCGAYNLGFIGLRQGDECRGLLEWWEQRCLAQGYNDPGFGVFVDQKWMDLVPCYFDAVRILKHRGCNVAYWNLHERSLSRAEGHWSAGGQPLVFFHFSGVRPHDPSLLSRHQTRHAIAPDSALAELVSQYCERLLAAGHARHSGLPYGYGTLTDGTPITATMRRSAACIGLDTGSPFDPASSLQQRLRSAGIARPGPAAASSLPTTLNFDASDWRVRWVNRLVRWSTRLLGVSRVELLLRYASFLAWQSNFAAVLLRTPPDFGHQDRRRPAP